jgi:hypothetical protein
MRAEALGKYLAWDSIVEEKKTLNLDPFRAKQAENQKQAAAGAVAARLPETFQWHLVPGATNRTSARRMAWAASLWD